MREERHKVNTRDSKKKERTIRFKFDPDNIYKENKEAMLDDLAETMEHTLCEYCFNMFECDDSLDEGVPIDCPTRELIRTHLKAITETFLSR